MGAILYGNQTNNTYNYYGTDEIIQQKDKEIEALKKELATLKNREEP